MAIICDHEIEKTDNYMINFIHLLFLYLKLTQIKFTFTITLNIFNIKDKIWSSSVISNATRPFEKWKILIKFWINTQAVLTFTPKVL